MLEAQRSSTVWRNQRNSKKMISRQIFPNQTPTHKGYLRAKKYRYQVPILTAYPIHCGWNLAEWLGRLSTNAVVAIVLGSIPASSDTVESKGRHEAVLNIVHKKKNLKKYPFSQKKLGTYKVI